MKFRSGTGDGNNDLQVRCRCNAHNKKVTCYFSRSVLNMDRLE
jgi:hypothetical protein